MKWTVVSPRLVWRAGDGRLSDRTVVQADKVEVVDGCLVFTDHSPDAQGGGHTVTPVLLLAQSSWSMCMPEEGSR